MNKKLLLPGGLTAIVVGIFITCQMETASGPTPYVSPKDYAGTSKTTVTMGAGQVTVVTVQKGLPIFTNQKLTLELMVDDDCHYDENYQMKGIVQSYKSSTGELVIKVTSVTGMGTFSKWGILLGNDQWVDSMIGTTSLADSLKKANDGLKSSQAAYVAMNFGMFVHFNMATFTRYNEKSVSGEWGVANSNPSLFKPSNLNCGQWADVAKSAGCKYMVLTTKHHDGFCLWDSKYTKHDIASSAWNSVAKRDIIKEFADSARSRGLKVGLYYSIWDKTNGQNLNFIKGQLTELLTGYGELTCLWFDGWKWMVGYSQVPHDTIETLIKRFQPGCMLVENNYYSNMTNTDIVEFEIPVNGEPKEGSIDPKEACESIRTDGLWFWHPIGLSDLLTVEKIKGRITTFHARNSTYLLNVTPDTTGVVPQSMADRMKEVGTALEIR